MPFLRFPPQSAFASFDSSSDSFVAACLGIFIQRSELRIDVPVHSLQSHIPYTHGEQRSSDRRGRRRESRQFVHASQPHSSTDCASFTNVVQSLPQALGIGLVCLCMRMRLLRRYECTRMDRRSECSHRKSIERRVIWKSAHATFTLHLLC